MKRVGKRLHAGATCAVAAFWILAAKSWMRTPQTYQIVNGRFVPTDWLAILFKPSMPYLFVHMLGTAVDGGSGQPVPGAAVAKPA